ncbi:MAG: flavodoxin family protein [Clostridia bacterium]|nr:flavodoxin family protein [Clostridia bacterium]
MKLENVLVLDGAGRKDGYTKKMISALLDYVQYDNAEIIELYEIKPEFCDGCNFCEHNERCRHRDLDLLFESFEKADLIIFASPVYNGTFSAPMKILIDRFQPYYTYFYKNNKTQKIKKRRKAILLASAGRDGEKSFAFMKEQLKFAFSVLNIEFFDSVLCNFTDTDAKKDEAINVLRNISERIDLC